MKKILVITALFCFSLATHVNAQCTPDPTYTSLGISGLYPTVVEGIDTGYVNMPYTQLFTIIVPTDTTYMSQTVAVNSVTITDVATLPAGLGFTLTPSSGVYPGGTDGCFTVNGLPTTTGSFTFTVSGTVEVVFFGNPIPIPQDYTYTIEIIDTSTGTCTMTVAGSGTDETATGLNDGTASVTPSGGATPYTYGWSSGQTTSSISGLSPGGYGVYVWDATGCLDSAWVTVNAFGFSFIPSLTANTFEVYPIVPNPSTDKAEIRFTISDYSDVKLSVHNMIGVVVMSRKIYAEKGLNIISLNADELKPGVYFITLSDGESTSTKRMVVGSK